MKYVFIILILFCSGIARAGDSTSQRKIQFYFPVVQAGSCYPRLLVNMERPYGIDLAGRWAAWGMNMGCGFELEYKRTAGVKGYAGFAAGGLRDKKFDSAMEQRFGAYQIDWGKYDYSSPDGVVTGYFSAYLYKLIRWRKCYWAAYAGIDAVKISFPGYTYALREKGTNYFTKYEVNELNNKKDWVPLMLGAGVEWRSYLADSTFRRAVPFSLFLHTSMGSATARYHVKEENYASGVKESDLSIFTKMILISVGVRLAIPSTSSASMKK